MANSPPAERTAWCGAQGEDRTAISPAISKRSQPSSIAASPPSSVRPCVSDLIRNVSSCILRLFVRCRCRSGHIVRRHRGDGWWRWQRAEGKGKSQRAQRQAKGRLAAVRCEVGGVSDSIAVCWSLFLCARALCVRGSLFEATTRCSAGNGPLFLWSLAGVGFTRFPTRLADASPDASTRVRCFSRRRSLWLLVAARCTHSLARQLSIGDVHHSTQTVDLVVDLPFASTRPRQRTHTPTPQPPELSPRSSVSVRHDECRRCGSHDSGAGHRDHRIRIRAHEVRQTER